MRTKELEQLIGYEFSDKNLIERALTHSSYNREKNTKHVDNERLEFLGDAFLDAIVSVELFNRLKNCSEGKLTKTRALVVCEKSLAEIARSIDLGAYLNMGYGEEQAGGRTKESIIADTMEAIIGALYIDGGYEASKAFVLKFFVETMDKAIEGKLFKDYKSEVQELMQVKGQVNICYQLDKEEGPDHDKTFYVHLVCDGVRYGDGVGKSKKEAEQRAAQETIEILKFNETIN